MNLNLEDLTLNAEEANEVGKAIFVYVLEQSDLAEHHDIVTGIQHKTQIPFIGTLGLVGKKILGCKPDANGNQIPFSEKFWDPVLIGDRFEHCATDLDPLLKLFKKAQKMNPDYFNRIDSEELGIVKMRVEQALKEMLQRLAWFSDTTVENVIDGGYLTNDTDITFFNMLDGIWKQIMSTDIPSGSRYHVPIAANGQATYALQQTLADDFAYELFRSMWRKADSRLKQLVRNGLEIHIHVTPGIYENWVDYREDKSLAFTLDKAENGGYVDLWRKLKVIPRYDWEETITSYQDNKTKWNLPNRALLTTPGNIPIGTVSTEDFEKLLSQYDAYNQVNFMDFALKIDAKFLQDYLAVAAY